MRQKQYRVILSYIVKQDSAIYALSVISSDCIAPAGPECYKIHMAISSIDELSQYIELSNSERKWNPEGESTLPILISDHLIPMLNNPAIRKQFVPDAAENEDRECTLDPQMEREHQGTSRLIHRYRNRAAFITTDRCFSYCRHCFRRRIAGSELGAADDKAITEAAAYVASHPEIKEILLTGGDMFTLSDERINQLLSAFREKCPSVILRLCTRAVAVYPERFTDNLMEIIRKNLRKGAPFYLMTQFNHPDELTDDAVEAVARFVDIGIPAMNQSVLLKGVNDDAAILEKLSEKLLLARIKPYYLFQGDPVRGTGHLRTTVSEGLKIEKELRKRVSGLGMPQYTIDLPQGGGKVILTHSYLVCIDEKRDKYVFETPDGETRTYPD